MAHGTQSQVTLPFPDWRPPSDPKRIQVTVVACTPHYFGGDYIHPFSLPPESGGPVHCNFTDDPCWMSEADALWFHAPSITRLPTHKRPGQAWVLMSMESDENYPMLKNKEFLNLFDIVMTYRLDSDVPTLYPNWREYGDFMASPLPTPMKSARTALALYTASNPVAHRDNYVRRLSKYVAVDSPGKCLHNKTLPGFTDGGNTWAKRGFKSIMEILPEYKFYLAFENSISTDYVTERLFLALVAGVVPVYYGADNVRDFLPSRDAAIVVDDFGSPAELAEYLKYLDNNNDAYERHLAWKSDGYCDNFRKLLDMATVDPRHRMALKLAHGCDGDCRCGGRMRTRIAHEARARIN